MSILSVPNEHSCSLANPPCTLTGGRPQLRRTSAPMPPSDLTLDAFLLLRDAFFTADQHPKPFLLPRKGATQDDPFDVYVTRLLTEGLPDATCLRAPGPLINPDLVVYRPDECARTLRADLEDDVTRIVAIEVKKLNRGPSGQVARSTGLDYNTTPPCGKIRTYDADNRRLDIHAFYLFVCQEPADGDRVQLTALALCDGDILNRDFDLYLRITGSQTKAINLGTYGDGMDRQRPMLVFANPLGAPQLDRAATLVTKADLSESGAPIRPVYQFGRTEGSGAIGLFNAYRHRDDVPENWEIEQFVDPFPKPSSRDVATQGRGRFRLPIRPLDPPRGAPDAAPSNIPVVDAVPADDGTPANRPRPADEPV